MIHHSFLKMFKKTLILFFFIGFLIPPVHGVEFTNPFEWEVNLSEKQIQAGEDIPLEIFFRIPPKHFLYRNKLELQILEGEGFHLSAPEYSPSYSKKDPFSEKTLEIFESTATLKTKIQSESNLSPGQYTLKLLLSYQGCSDSLCYRQMKHELSLPILIKSASNKTSIPVLAKSFWLALLLTFLAGIGSDFTPCVLPIIPITLAFFGVQKKQEGSKNILLSSFFILAMALTYSTLGMAAALLGKGLGFLFQNSYFLIFTTLLYFVLALSLFGLFDIQLPFVLRNRLARLGGQGILGAGLAGVTTGFLAAPCVGPLIASLLLYVAQERNVLRGFALLFTYGLGMGSVFFVVGTFYQRFATKIRGGAYTIWVKRVFGVLILLPAIYYGSIAYQQLHSPSSKIIEVPQNSFWMTDPDQAFAKASAEGKPLFVDFFATWCLPCVKMEQQTFSDPKVQAFLREHFIPVQMNCTQETPACQKMIERYSVVGWPTMLVLTPEGKVQESFVGRSFSPEELLQTLSKIH